MEALFRVTFVFVLMLSMFAGSACFEPVAAKKKSQAAAMSAQKDLQYGAVDDGKSFVAGLTSTAKGLNDYSFQSEIITYRSDSNVVKESGHFFYKKPNLVRLEVLGGPKKGALLIMGSDGKIRGHLGGVLKMINGSVGRDSKFLISSNGFNMVECDFGSLLSDLERQIGGGLKATVTSSPVAVVGKPQKMHVVEIRQGTAPDSPISQRIYVDPKTNLPQEWQIFKGGSLFCTTVWSDIRINQGLALEAFTLRWRG
jgi:outer membrane lipoprotein-sorting protein